LGVAAVQYVLIGFLLMALITGVVIWIGGKGTKGEFAYLLVLGTKVNGEKPGNMLRDRINAAFAYLTAHPDVTAIVSGYRSGAGRISEAECMRRELIARGIAPERLISEENATSTKENLEFAMELIERKTGERPKVLGALSSEHHLCRAGLLAKRQGIETVRIPAKTAKLSVLIPNFLREIPLIWYYIIFA
jgi:uncharacterized SAM-binding protein YcdF (DUF218 family)